MFHRREHVSSDIYLARSLILQSFGVRIIAPSSSIDSSWSDFFYWSQWQELLNCKNVRMSYGVPEAWDIRHCRIIPLSKERINHSDFNDTYWLSTLRLLRLRLYGSVLSVTRHPVSKRERGRRRILRVFSFSTLRSSTQRRSTLWRWSSFFY